MSSLYKPGRVVPIPLVLLVCCVSSLFVAVVCFVLSRQSVQLLSILTLDATSFFDEVAELRQRVDAIAHIF